MTLAPERTAISPTAPHVSEPNPTRAEHHQLNTRLSVAGGAERTHPPKKSGRPNPMAHLTNEEIEAIGRELDAALAAERAGRRSAGDAQLCTAARACQSEAYLINAQA